MGAAVTDDGSISVPGRRSRCTGSAGQTAATYALASAAYRDSAVTRSSRPTTSGTSRRSKPAARSQAVRAQSRRGVLPRRAGDRMLGGGRKPLIQSFGTEPQAVVEHCLAANRIRKERDTWLTVVMVLCGLLFLPGLLLWLLVFQLRATMRRARGQAGRRARHRRCWSALGGLRRALPDQAAVHRLLGAVLRARASSPRSSAGSGPSGSASAPRRTCATAGTACCPAAASAPRSPRRCRSSPGETARRAAAPGPGQAQRRAAVQLRLLRRPQGHTRHGHPLGQLAARRGAGRRRTRARRSTPSAAGTSSGRSTTSCACWSAARCTPAASPSRRYGTGSSRPIGEGAKEVSRPERHGRRGLPDQGPRDTATSATSSSSAAATGTTWACSSTLWDGQLVITMLITVTVLHETLRIEVTGHALGPVHSLFTSKPAAKDEGGRTRRVRFWETRRSSCRWSTPTRWSGWPRARRFTWYPPLLDCLGGKLTLPEPFGLRHAWADKPWRHRFMADDALRAATPVLRVVHAAAIRVLEENGVDTEQFGSRSLVPQRRGPGRRRRRRPTSTTRRLRRSGGRGSRVAARALPPARVGLDGSLSAAGQASASILRVSAEELRQHLGVADDRHEVGVAAPARARRAGAGGRRCPRPRPRPGSCRC